jgi:hypothetical protein
MWSVCNYFYVFKELILNMCYTEFFLIFKIYALIEEHGHKMLRLPLYLCHLNPTELVGSHAKRYYNRNISWIGFGIEIVKEIWEE